MRSDVPTRGRPTLADRSRTSGIGTPTPPGTAAPSTARTTTSSRPPASSPSDTGRPAATASSSRHGATPAHCWVLHDDDPGRSPGLLLAWSRTPHGWTALVAFAVPYGDSHAVVQAWLPAGQLRPAWL